MTSIDPIFKGVFGKDWELLPRIMRRHYANRPFHNDRARVEGILTVESSRLGRLLNPFLRLASILVPYEGENIPVTVDFISSEKDNSFAFYRRFHFPAGKVVIFYSRLLPQGGAVVIERMNWGLCWRSTYRWDGHKIILSHLGYALNIGSLFLPLPLTWLIGEGYAEETPLNDDEFAMLMEIRHPHFGKIMGYSGVFRMTKDCA